MTPGNLKRKLAAILSADVQGYSRLMGEDEEGTIHTLKVYMEVITGFIHQHRGRVVATGGDSVLADFASVVDAVRCAVGIQEELKDRNKDFPAERRMEFRIGVNLGDVVEEGDNILGDGVNIAARVQSLAEAGGICIAGIVYDQIKNKLAFGYEYVGEQTVKNIKEPVRVYRVLMEPGVKVPEIAVEKPAKTRQWQKMAISLLVVLIVVAASIATWRLYLRPTPPPGEVASKQKMALPLPDKPSIAVLPFNNLGSDSGEEALADGVTENITTTLSKIPGLFVIARNSASQYKGKPMDVKKVAENLGVRYVLEGSVQKSGGRIRINAQLIDATSGHHIWSEKYDRDMKNLFALFDDITRNIAVALQIKLTEGEQARVFHRNTENLEVWALTSKAWDLISRFTREDNARTRELAEQAVKLDPQDGFAWSLLAYSYFNAARMKWCEPSEEEAYFKKAVELNQKALTLNKDLFCATAMVGQIRLAQRQYEQAIELGRRAIELGPSISASHIILATTLYYAGNFEEAITLGEKAIRLHPFGRPINLFYLARIYTMAGRYDEALALYRKILNRAQEEAFNPLLVHTGLAEVYSEMGRVEEAHAQALEILRIDPSFSLENWRKTEPFKDPANLQRRLVALRKAGLK